MMTNQILKYIFHSKIVRDEVERVYGSTVVKESQGSDLCKQVPTPVLSTSKDIPEHDGEIQI
jgi:hypothetical protein